jgi:hypothetical protein
MAKIIKDDGMMWFRIRTPKNFTSESRFDKWRTNNWPKHKLVKSLIAQHNSATSANYIVDKLQESKTILLSYRTVLINLT